VKPRVSWLSFATLRKTPLGWTSDVASARYRLTIPARALQDLGCESTVIDAASYTDYRGLLKRLEATDVAILGKLVAPPDRFLSQSPRILELAQALQRAGVRVVADFSDDGFREPVRGAYFSGLANLADALVASTEGLAEILRDEAPTPVSVVGDPVEGRQREPRVLSSAPLRLLWYGHHTNLDTLTLGIAQLAAIARRIPLAITLITNEGPVAQAYLNDVARLPQTTCRLVPWTLLAVFEALKETDAVFIPSAPDERRRAVKSPNRFTEAIWAGRFVVAHPLPAYRAFADFGWVGDDIGVGLEWLLQNPASAFERIRAGQALIEAKLMPSAIAAQWRAAILANG
jgi:hypothetical protein